MLVIAGRRWFISVPPPRPRPPLPGGAPPRGPGRRWLAYCRVPGRSGGGGRRQQLFLRIFWPPGSPAGGRVTERVQSAGDVGVAGLPVGHRQPDGPAPAERRPA